MPSCNGCCGLHNDPATAAPHEALRGGAVFSKFGSAVERYSCSICGSVWDCERTQLADKSSRRAWQMLRGSREARIPALPLPMNAVSLVDSVERGAGQLEFA